MLGEYRDKGTSPTPTGQKAGPLVPGQATPHIGTDEVGKGDYFGPLVCVAWFVKGYRVTHDFLGDHPDRVTGGEWVRGTGRTL